jgi:Kdo2-lipid IVA lauroyltransferase/acyltransferase
MMILLKLLRFLPLPVLRALGVVLGYLIYALLAKRRHTVQTNLTLCFPEWPAHEQSRKAREVFVYFAQSWLDRFWLWHSPQATLNKRLRIVPLGGQSGYGLQANALLGDEPTVIFAPHFVGLDAGWTALNLLSNRRYATIYAAQSNASVDAWVKAGRARTNDVANPPLLIDHHAGVRPIIQAIRRGEPLYLLPDMNYEPLDSLFVPFFGVPAATLPVLSRYAKLGGKAGVLAKVVPVVTRMTKSGYDIEIHPAWENYPSGDSVADLEADTRRMNAELENYVRTMPAQYYWVHRRFKDQPSGANSTSGPNPYDKQVVYTRAI